MTHRSKDKWRWYFTWLRWINRLLNRISSLLYWISRLFWISSTYIIINNVWKTKLALSLPPVGWPLSLLFLLNIISFFDLRGISVTHFNSITVITRLSSEFLSLVMWLWLHSYVIVIVLGWGYYLIEIATMKLIFWLIVDLKGIINTSHDVWTTISRKVILIIQIKLIVYWWIPQLVQ